MFVLLLAGLAFGYSVFWGEFVHCDVGSCRWPNPNGDFLWLNRSAVVFDTGGDPSVMGFYVVALDVGRHMDISIRGWWSYGLPRTLAYLISEKSGVVLECSTGGGQSCSVSGRVEPGVYYLVLVDAWAQQTVVVEGSGELRLADVSAGRAACALARAGVLVGQVITYAFDWPQRPGVPVWVEVSRSGCVLPGGALGEALAFIAAAGLGEKDANRLLSVFNLSAVVERRYGYVYFELSNGSFYVVPLVYEAQVGQWGRFVAVNPSNVTVRWSFELYVNGSRVAKPLVVELPPRSYAPVYVYGVGRVEGPVEVSYRVEALGVYSFGGVVYRGGRVTGNGSLVNWLWGFLEGLWGRAVGDRCVEARGAGRRWVAERLGLAGVATELDTAAGGAALVLSVGSYLPARAGARSAVEAVEAAERAAEGYKLLRRATAVLAAADVLMQGGLLGWNMYMRVASGEVPVEELGSWWGAP